ncbi:MAG: UDP-N-acetylmuramoyl-tripeptide--D-alanyl-D-alanine ligase, partial [Eubacteriales bacterium]
MKPMTLGEIAKAANGVLNDSRLENQIIDSIVIDSRKATAGSLYIPVIGETNDGHAFIEGAFKNGAVCTLTERDETRSHIRVAATFQALKDIAEYYRSLFDIPVIALTGSVGKTTAKDMIASVLSQKYYVHKTPGNFNNEFGLPQAVFGITEDHEAVVLELGMNNFGEISRLSKVARPDICMILNIGVSHIGRLGSQEGILKAKSEIFDYMKENGKAYLNGDDPYLIKLNTKKLSPILFGQGANNDVKVTEVLGADISGTHFTAKYKDETFDIQIPCPGKHMIPATLAALAIGYDLGLTAQEIGAGVKAFTPSGERLDMIQTKKITVLNDVYNACPESIMAGIDVLALADGRKVAILGDVFELDAF